MKRPKRSRGDRALAWGYWITLAVLAVGAARALDRVVPLWGLG